MKIMKICITGSSGLIGSHLSYHLRDNDKYELCLIDNRITHNPVDILDYDKLQGFFNYHRPEIVIHLAALIDVGESERETYKYWLTNLQGTSNVLQAMLSCGCNKIIFASTAAVYGNPSDNPQDGHGSLGEDSPKQPVSVYGKTKLAAENLIKNYCRQFSFRSCIFRFFNVGGSLDNHPKQIHLIPIILQKIIHEEPLTIFGQDYQTRDGTCLRDYIHVLDLCVALTRAIDLVTNEDGAHIFNLGHNKGYTVAEIVAACNNLAQRSYKLAAKKKLPVIMGPRREGDPDALIANPQKARENKYLQWDPQKTITDIISDTIAVL